MVPVRRHARDWHTYFARGGLVLKTRRRFIIGYAILSVIIFGLFSSSESFQKCEHERKDRRGYQQLHQSRSSILKGVARLELHASCALSDEGILSLIAAMAVAGFTFTLGRSTQLLYIAGERQLGVAKQAADAATAAANASMVQERPHLFLMLDQSNVGYTSFYNTVFPDIGYTFKNFGRSPAIIDRYYIQLSKSRSPVELTERSLLRAYFDRVLPEGASTARFAIEPTEVLSSEDRQAIVLGQESMFLYGWVRYSDVFGGNRTRWFMMVYDPDIDRFLDYDGEKYNKEIEEEPASVLKAPFIRWFRPPPIHPG